MASANGKWITDVSPRDRARCVARRTLASRLGAVERYLPLAARRADEIVEYVHELRVATRRVAAAMRMYQPLLPRGRARQLRKQLRQIRRAAGHARNYDVLIARQADAVHDQETEHVLAYLRARRQDAQQPIVDLHARMAEDPSYQQSVAALLAGLANDRGGDAGRTEPRFGKWARARMRKVVKKFFKNSPKDLGDLDALHRFRIQGKKLRYAMELFAAAFPRAFRAELYHQVERIQEKLGRINDHCSALNRLRDVREGAEDLISGDWLPRMRQAEEAGLREKMDDIARWWTPDRCQKLRRLKKTLAI